MKIKEKLFSKINSSKKLSYKISTEIIFFPVYYIVSIQLIAEIFGYSYEGLKNIPFLKGLFYYLRDQYYIFDIKMLKEFSHYNLILNETKSRFFQYCLMWEIVVFFTPKLDIKILNKFHKFTIIRILNVIQEKLNIIYKN